MTKIVDILCKTMRKSLRIFYVKLCVNLHFLVFYPFSHILFQTFSHVFHRLFHSPSPPVKPPLFHFSTMPTITTIYKLNIK